MEKQKDENQKESLKKADSGKNLFKGLFSKSKNKDQSKDLKDNKSANSAIEKGENISAKPKNKNSLLGFFGKSSKTSVQKTGIENIKEPIQNKETKPEKKQVSPKSLLSGLFKKAEKNGKTSETTQKTEEKGKKNLFVDLFPQEVEKNEDDSLIETIVEQSDKKQSILGQKLHDKKQEELKNKEATVVAEPNDKLFLSYAAIVASLIIPLTIYIFFHFHLTPSSQLLDIVGIKNTGMSYAENVVERDKLILQIDDKKKAIAQLEEVSQQRKMETIITDIKTSKHDWLVVMDYINEVTNEGIRYNDLLKRVVYNSYNLNQKENKIALNAEIFDPNKQVFTLATSLIDAVNESEYFSGLENRNFSKSIDEEGAKMTLTMNFNYVPKTDRENLTTVLEK